MHRNASNRHVKVKSMNVKHTVKSIEAMKWRGGETTVRCEEDMCKWNRRKIVTLPSPTRQGSQTWCTALIPGIYCGVEVRVISMVFYTCRLRWFRSATAAFVRFTKAGDGKWKWGQSPCRCSHKHVSQIPWNLNEASQSSHWCPTWLQRVHGGGSVFSSLVSSTTIGRSFEPNELMSACWWISTLIALRICSWDKGLMGEGVAVRSFFGEGAWSGGNSSLVDELSVEEVEGEALRP